MGEQLYGDPALAIRELYQNALDACRYREARTEYLSRTRDLDAAGWAGRIRFEQGVDDAGRPYLDCVDNGIGMGVRELSEVFAQAGVRLATCRSSSRSRPSGPGSTRRCSCSPTAGSASAC